MHAFEEVARPVIFEHSDENFPYWGSGSSMLLANSQHFFWVTASHVLKNLGGALENLRIFPSDVSTISLPFIESYQIQCGESDDEYRDILVLRINLKEFDKFGDVPLRAQNIELGLLSAEELAVDAELWIVGYPEEKNCIDYEQAQIKNSRAVIRAIYQGASLSDHCCTAKINSSIQLTSYNGLSGSPIFYLQPIIQNSQEVLFPRLVGMLLRGTAESGFVHFVSANVIGELIKQASHSDS